MSTKTPIAAEDVRKGDLIRIEHNREGSATEYRASGDGHTGYAGKHFLLERPKKIIHAKGTTLYARHNSFQPAWFAGDAVTVAQDYREGDLWIYVNGGTSENQEGLPASHFTTEKPRKIKWAKGTKLWFVDSAENRAWFSHRIGTEYVVKKDVYEGDDYYVDDYFASRFTDVEPITLVAVPLTAIKKLRDDNGRATGFPKAVSRSAARNGAIHTFLAQRSIRLALGEDEQPW